MLQRTRWALACAVFGVSIIATSCGLFSDDADDDPFDVAIKQDVPVEFNIDENMLCPPTEMCGDDVPTAPSPGPVDLPEAKIPVPIDVIEATMSQELADAAGRLKKVEIEAIEYVIAPNTLNIPSPPLELYIAPPTTTNHEAQGNAFIGTLPSADPMTETSGTIEVSEEDQEKASELFKALEFNVIAYGDKDIEEGEQFPPQGRTDYKLTFKLKFTANPVDQF